MSTLNIIAVWLIIFGALALVPTEIPKWIVPLTAILVGLWVLGTSFKKTP